MYGCPGCGAELKYDIKTGKLRCSRCGNKYDVQAIKKDKDAESSLYEINEYVCPSCGGRIYTADNTIAGFCSYCGASAILQQRTETIDAPKSIVPFKVEKRVCKTKFKNFAKKNMYVPDEYKTADGINEFRGIYLPYHSYDAEVAGVYDAYGSTETTKKKKKKIYTTKKYWKIHAPVHGYVKGITHDDSGLFRDDLSEAVNDATDSKAVVDFRPGYLCGFYADMSDVSASEYENYAYVNSKEYINNQIKCKVGSNMHINKTEQEPQIKISCKEDILKPVWFMSYQNRNRVAYAVINGHTGKMNCDLPVDFKKFFGVSAIISAILFIILMCFQSVMFTAKTMIGIAAVFNLIAGLFYDANIRKMYDREIKRTYKLKKSDISKLVAITVGAFMLMYFIISFVITVNSEYRESSKWVKAVICAVTFVMQVIMIIKNYHKYEALKKNNTVPSPVFVLSVIINIIIMAVAVINPVHDIWYYVATAMALASEVIVVIGIIRDYNYSCTRPLPQFKEYKGGQENIEIS